jgi:hypothetical protein
VKSIDAAGEKSYSMRTTVRIEDSLLRRAKAAAAASGRSLNDLIVDPSASLASRPSPARVVELPTSGGNGLHPGVDLDDSAALLDLKEGRADLK